MYSEVKQFTYLTVPYSEISVVNLTKMLLCILGFTRQRRANILEQEDVFSKADLKGLLENLTRFFMNKEGYFTE